MIVKICVGSSCHLKGSYDVLEQMKSIVKKYNVEDVVTLQASFCLGDCAEGVTVRSESGEGAGAGDGRKGNLCPIRRG